MPFACLLLLLVLLSDYFFDGTILRAPDSAHSILSLTNSSPQLCEGELLSIRTSNLGKTKLMVRLRGCQSGNLLAPVVGNVQLTLPVKVDLKKHDILRFRSSFRQPDGYYNPGSFNFRKFALARHIDAYGFVADPAWITAIGQTDSSWMSRSVQWMRGRIQAALPPNGKAGELLATLSMGATATVESDLVESFREAGVAHILVVSGLHVGFVAMLFFFLFSRFFKIFNILLIHGKVETIGAAMTILLVWGYVALCDGAISAVRAGIMVTLYFLSLCLKRRVDITTTLCAAIVLILAMESFSLYDISFQFSMLAVIGMALLIPRIQPIISRWRSSRIPYYFLTTFITSLAVTLTLLPLMLYYFKEITLIGIFSNLLVIPLAALLLTPLAMIASLVSALSITGGATIFLLASYPATLLLKIVDYLAVLGQATTVRVAFTGWELLFYYGMILVLLFWPRRYFRHSCSLLMGGFCIASIFSRYHPPHQLEVTFLDVGQGSAAVVRTPDNRVIMIDGGGIAGSDFDIGRFVIAPYLWTMGIHRVEALIVTHPDADHFMGFNYIRDHFSPEIIYYNGDQDSEQSDDAWQVFCDGVRERGIPFVALHKESKPIQIGEVTLSFLAPPEKAPPKWSKNDRSIVVKLSYGRRSFLFPGDLESAGESVLLENYGSAPVDVLSVPHHGSRSSSTAAFIEAVRPSYSVVQAGRFNRFGHPHREVEQRYRERGIPLLDTRHSGAITFSSNGESLEVNEYRH